MTLRLRLTLLYGSLFLLAGVVLLGVTYLLMDQSLTGSGMRPASRTVAVIPGEAVTAATATPATPLDPGFVQTRTITTAELRKIIDEGNQEVLNSLLAQGAIALTITALAAFGAGWLLAGRALRPLHRITATAKGVAVSRDLSARIGYRGPRDDVKELADSFDVMMERLDRSFDGQRRFVANASHELRTPLALNRTMVDIAMRRPSATDDVKRLGTDLLVVNARHERLIDGLLALADSENPIVDPVPADLRPYAARAVELLPEGLKVTARLEPAPVTGDPVLLERLVQNLVENAVKHNDARGEIAIETRSDGGETVLTVASTGPVIDPAAVEGLFEPFRRLQDRTLSADGAGLGLSIVRAIAAAHDGTLTAAAPPLGGLAVTVRLPVTPSEVVEDPRTGGSASPSR
ncbi:ATP-binding protein [Actinocorallia lasiicapitis]